MQRKAKIDVVSRAVLHQEILYYDEKPIPAEFPNYFHRKEFGVKFTISPIPRTTFFVRKNKLVMCTTPHLAKAIAYYNDLEL